VSGLTTTTTNSVSKIAFVRVRVHLRSLFSWSCNVGELFRTWEEERREIYPQTTVFCRPGRTAALGISWAL